MSYNEATIKEIAEHLLNTREYNRGAAILIGAGMSVSAGIPTADGMVKELRAEYPNLCSRLSNNSYPEHMRLMPPAQRNKFIKKFIERAELNAAHIYMSTLIKCGYVDRVLTTNFDTLVARSLALENIFPGIYDFASSQHFVPGESADISIFHLHGQKDGFVLLHTDDEVKAHSEKVSRVISDTLINRTIIVVGYSGKNDPVFKHFEEIKSFGNKLFWVGYKNNEPEEHIQKGILSDSDKYAYYVKGYDADEFFIELAKEMKLEAPRILNKPFSYLSEIISSISKIRKADREVAATRETQKWVDFAIRIFENGEDIKDVLTIENEVSIREDEIIKLARETWLNMKYESYEELKTILAHNNIHEAKQYFAYFLNDWAISLGDLAKSRNREEAVRLYREAISKYEEATYVNPDYDLLYYNMGTFMGDLAKLLPIEEAEILYEKSFPNYSKAVKLNPEYYEAYYNWGIDLANLSKLKTDDIAEPLLRDSLTKFEMATTIKPDYHDAYSNWANSLGCLAEIKNGAEAEGLYREGISKLDMCRKLKPEDPNTYYNLGNHYGELAKLKTGEEAEELFKKSFSNFESALKLKPDYQNAYANWGIFLTYLAKLKSSSEARDIYHESLTILEKGDTISKGGCLYDIACVHALLGDTEAAITKLIEAIELGKTPSIDYIKTDEDLKEILEDERLKPYLE